MSMNLSACIDIDSVSLRAALLDLSSLAVVF